MLHGHGAKNFLKKEEREDRGPQFHELPTQWRGQLKHVAAVPQTWTVLGSQRVLISLPRNWGELQRWLQMILSSFLLEIRPHIWKLTWLTTHRENHLLTHNSAHAFLSSSFTEDHSWPRLTPHYMSKGTQANSVPRPAFTLNTSLTSPHTPSPPRSSSEANPPECKPPTVWSSGEGCRSPGGPVIHTICLSPARSMKG